MYSVYVSLGIAVALALAWIFLDLWGGFFMGFALGSIAFLVVFVVIARRLGKRIQPLVLKAQKSAEAGQITVATSALESLLPLRNWIPMLKGQLYGQLGVLSLGANKKSEAIDYLEKASNRAVEAKLFLASIHYKAGNLAAARRVLDAAQRWNKKHVLLHNLYAYMLSKKGDVDGAIAQLNRLASKVPENETTQNNLKRLKNGTKMTMKPFGMEWYAMRLEDPPASMGQMQAPRRGFRQPSTKKR